MTATILAFPTPALRRRGALGDNFRWPSTEPIFDFTMVHADPEDTGMPSDSAYHAHDGA